MENKIFIVTSVLVGIISLVFIAKPVCFYKIQEVVMGWFHIKVEYDKNNLLMGRIVGVILLALVVFGTIMQLS